MANDPIAALEAECARLRDELATVRLSAAAVVAAEHEAEQRAATAIHHAAAEALREAAYELAQRADHTRDKPAGWATGIRDAVATVRARAAIEDAAHPAQRWRPPRPRQHH